MQKKLFNCLAPAKINLFLHIVDQRSKDNYYPLQTVFQLIDRCDVLDISIRYDGKIFRTNNIPGIPANTDLVVRAGKLLQVACRQFQLGANITVTKKLPIGGGLGSGSSNAATALIILNYLWQTKLNRLQLMQLGIKLGADVPFFLFGTNAFAENIGEILVPLKTPNCWFIVIEPGVFVSTKKIFSSPELTKYIKPLILKKFDETTDFFNNNFLENSLEKITVKKFPIILDIMKWLQNFGNPKMSGSGSCVFCAFKHEHYADEVLKQVPIPWIAWKAKTLQEHPLTHFLNVR